MARATPANYIFPQISDDEENRQNKNEEEAQVENAELFTAEELDQILNIEKVEEGFIEVACACTSQKHGVYRGLLTIYGDGRLRINCRCTPNCQLVNAKPEQFVSHARGKGGPGQWPRLIWVYNGQGVKKSLHNTPFLRYFHNAGKKVEKRLRKKFHKDEFVKCSQCRVERRFRLERDPETCRAYHDAALMVKTWTCSMHPSNKINCNSEAERTTRKRVRGCPDGSCGGCHRCACTGCFLCRFADCDCKMCWDYIRNS